MDEATHKILVAEDDEQIQSFIGYVFEQDGFSYLSADSGHNAMSLLIPEPIELLPLDLGLPDCDGMEIIKRVREWSDMPIIVVSARDQDREKAAVLDAGADDYLTKPFSATELLAHIRVAIRHLYRQSGEKPQVVYRVGRLKIDIEKRPTYLQGKELRLTPMEYSLLALLFKNCDKVLTTQYIIHEVWGVGYGSDTQALRALMAVLHRKIEKNPVKPRCVATEIGVGYRLVDE